MYLINQQENRISKIKEKSFRELGFSERYHLQEWLAYNPEALGEELLIIQKEFDGFNDTNERLDLLALDQQGNLVIIENKLDDTGRDVTWQALKYASYCSTLKKEQIKDIYQHYLDKQGKNERAEDNLGDFFNVSDFAEVSLNSGQTQRIIMVARNFRKEVTSTALWLLNYKLRIQCFKATPYQLGDQLFLNIEQVIPMQEAEEYVISMAEKTQDAIDVQEGLKARHHLRIEFWTELLKEVNKQLSLFQNINPSKENWLSGSSGISGVGLNFSISKSYARVELYMNRPVKEENKFIFDQLSKLKSEIEDKLDYTLEWERCDDKVLSKIKIELLDVSYFEKESWSKMIDFMVNGMVEMEKVLKPYLQKIKLQLKGH